MHEYGFALQASLHSNQKTDLSAYGAGSEGFILPVQKRFIAANIIKVCSRVHKFYTLEKGNSLKHLALTSDNLSA
jgi:hypothetical protein